jgi:transposase
MDQNERSSIVTVASESQAEDTVSCRIVRGDGAAESTVIDEPIWSAVLAMHRQGLSQKGIAHALGLDRKTVRKWLRQAWSPQQRPSRAGKTALWQEWLERRAPEVGYNGVVLLRELQAQGYAGSYVTLTRAIKALRPAAACELPTVRFETGPGEQAQVDWGQVTLCIGGARQRTHFFVMVLGYSRRIFAVAFARERLESLLEAHELAFSHFGGRTRTILYDNPRTIVTEKNESTGTIVWNRRFKDRMDFYGVEVRLCRYYRAQTKGKVESGIKYVKQNALAGVSFASLERLNEYLLDWCVSVADERIHGTTHEKPALRFAHNEATALAPVTARPPVYCEHSATRRVPRDAYVVVETNRYPVPWEWVGREVVIRLREEELSIGAQGEVGLRHARLTGRHQTADWPRDTAPRGPVPRALAASRWTRDWTPGCGHRPYEPPRSALEHLRSIGEVEVRGLECYEQLAQGHWPVALASTLVEAEEVAA